MKHPYDAVIVWGRCRDDDRWLWTAFEASTDGEHAYGWADTEDEATQRAQSAAFRLAADRRTHTTRRHGEAVTLAWRLHSVPAPANSPYTHNCTAREAS